MGQSCGGCSTRERRSPARARALRRAIQRSVARSAVRLHEEQKPNRVMIAASIQAEQIEHAGGQHDRGPAAELEDRAGLATVSSRPAGRSRDMSRGSSAILRPSSAACVPALACTRPTSPASRNRSAVFSTLTASRAARTAITGSGDRGAADGASERRPVDDLAQRAADPLRPYARSMRPVLRAALTSERPSRTGAPAPTVA